MTIISTNMENDSGDGYKISGDNVTLVVSQNITILGSTTASDPGYSQGSGISDYDYVNNKTYKDITLYNYGNILSDSQSGISVTDFGDNGFGHITNGASGSISGYSRGANLGEDDNLLVNIGTIDGSASYGLGVTMDDKTGEINNTGTISGGYIGIFTQSTVSFRLRNSGAIGGGTGGLSIEGYDSSTIANINNSGVINGGSFGISCDGSVKTTIRNTGEIDGNVKFANGNNTFDGRGGKLSGGYIAGGTKVDTVYLGNDGETVNGGAGHDILNAGTGDDVFAFSSYTAANSDTIFGFNVSDDLIQLNHAQFSKLAVGARPTFTVGTAASSAKDYLFYNSGSGNLFYDPDGNGSGAANLIAKLDPGLRMTAHDFKVI